MKYYRDVDYFIYFEDFPHMGVVGIIVSNSDGTSNIYINTLYTLEKQRLALQHELRHLARQHLHCDWMTIEEKELEADDQEDPLCIFADDFSSVEYIGTYRKSAPPQRESEPEKLPDIFAEAPPGMIPVFADLEAFRDYMFAMREQYQRDH